MFGRYDFHCRVYVHANICSLALKFWPDNGSTAVTGSPLFITVYPEGCYDLVGNISWWLLQRFFFLDISLENQNKNVMVALKGNCSLTCCWHQTKRQRVIKVFRIHPLGIVNMWPKIHCSQSNNCWDFSAWIKEVNRPIDWLILPPMDHVASIHSNHLLPVQQRTQEVIFEGQHFFLSLC